jgi:hypothetical protein
LGSSRRTRTTSRPLALRHISRAEFHLARVLAVVTGTARVVQCVPKVALALGYDVDAALERHDP